METKVGFEGGNHVALGPDEPILYLVVGMEFIDFTFQLPHSMVQLGGFRRLTLA